MTPDGRPSVRLAIAMNGGVSLAVWMGGVTHELDRLRRSDPEVTAPASPAWSTLTKALDKRVVIDLITGTSAGGLNGTLLATAIGRGSPLPNLKDVWRQDGRLERDKLLAREPLPAPNSVLNGRFFEGQVQTHLNDIGDPQPTGSDNQDDIALLVTASALSGSSLTGQDMLGRSFAGGDHRRLYRFSSRGSARRWYAEDPPPAQDPPENDFLAKATELSRAARASAGFPFAFESVLETLELAKLDIMRPGADPTWLMDGGVLDNAPIGPLLRELHDRPRTDPGDRFVVYLVPSTESSEPHLETGPGAPAPHWTILPGRIVALWRESDIRTDIEDLRDLGRQSRASALRPENLLNPATSALDQADLSTTAATLFPAYRRTRAAEILGLVEATNAGERLGGRPPDPAQVDQLLALGPITIPTTPTPTTPPDQGSTWQWGIGPARRLALYLSRDARRQNDPLTPAAIDALARAEWELLELHKKMDALINRALSGDSAVTAPLEAADQMLRASGLLTETYQTLRTAVSTWADARGLPEEDAWERLLAIEVLLNATTWQHTDTAPPFDFLMISPETPWRGTPLDLSAIANSKDWGSAKLYGTRFNHFGAFFEDSWKDWDWLWGRLDAALTLADALATKLPPPKRDAVDLTAVKNALVEEILAEEGGLTPQEVTTRAYTLVNTTTGALLKAARDSNQVDFDALLSDAKRMTSEVRIFPTNGGKPWSFVTAKGADWAKRRVIATVFWYARRKLARL